jgi:hypothetical protein
MVSQRKPSKGRGGAEERAYDQFAVERVVERSIDLAAPAAHDVLERHLLRHVREAAGIPVA